MLNMPMDKELKARWVEALRSGKYQQAKGVLKDTHGRYCCIGVLGVLQGCDIEREFPTTSDRECCTLPSYCVQPGLSDRNNLAEMNDGEVFADDGWRQYSFAEIADWIEANL